MTIFGSTRISPSAAEARHATPSATMPAWWRRFEAATPLAGHIGPGLAGHAIGAAVQRLLDLASGAWRSMRAEPAVTGDRRGSDAIPTPTASVSHLDAPGGSVTCATHAASSMFGTPAGAPASVPEAPPPSRGVLTPADLARPPHEIARDEREEDGSKRDGRGLALEAVLTRQTHWGAFMRFAQGQYCHENLCFIHAARRLDQITDPGELRRLFASIYKQMIDPERASLQVNLSDRMFKVLAEMAAAPDARTDAALKEAIREAEVEIFELVKGDVLPRFLASDAYKDAQRAAQEAPADRG